MAIDFGPDDARGWVAPEEEALIQQMKVGALEMVQRTFTVWFRRVLDYILACGIIIAALHLTAGVVVVSIFGMTMEAQQAISVVSLDPSSVVVSLYALIIEQSPLVPYAIVLGVTAIIIGALASGAAVRLVLWDYGNPGQGTVQESVSWSASNLPRVAGTMVAVGVITGGLNAPLRTLISQIQGLSEVQMMQFLIDNSRLFLLAFVLVIVGIYISIRMLPVVAALIYEDTGIADALKRSYELTSGAFWHTVGSYLALAIAVGIVNYFLSLIVGSLLYAVYMGSVITYAIVTMLTGPVYYVYVGILYRDLRAREEIRQQQFW